MQSDTETTPPAPAAMRGTIDTNRLGDVWLPAFRKEQASVEYMEKACMRVYTSQRLAPMLTAWIAVTRMRDETVLEIRRRGGLLLIGGAQRNEAAHA